MLCSNILISFIELYQNAGQIRFAENYCDELLEKAKFIEERGISLQWSFIGSLQSNKIKKIVEVAHEIQTIASIKQARYINRYAAEYHKVPFPVFIQINYETNKIFNK